MALEQKAFPSTQESRVSITASREIRGQNGLEQQQTPGISKQGKPLRHVGWKEDSKTQPIKLSKR